MVEEQEGVISLPPIDVWHQPALQIPGHLTGPDNCVGFCYGGCKSCGIEGRAAPSDASGATVASARKEELQARKEGEVPRVTETAVESGENTVEPGSCCGKQEN